MSAAADPELLRFAGEVLERRGGVLEQAGEVLLALLPAPLAQSLELPEDVEVGSAQAPLLYGSPLLDRLVTLATAEVPVVYGCLETVYLKKAGFEALLRQDLAFTEGQVRLGSRAEARTTYMVLVCHYLALSDERKEGLVQLGVHEGGGALIPGLETQWQNGGARFYAPGKVPPHFPVHLETALRRGLESSQAVVAEQLQDFLKSMERRLRREVRNVEEYFLTLRQEMEVNLQRANLTEAQLEERRAKIAALPQELERQAVDLEHKYQVRVQVQPAAALRLLVDVVQLQVELKWRKLGRSLKVIFNPVTRSLDPLVCEGCGATIRRIYPAVAGNGVLLLCRSCSSSKGKK